MKPATKPELAELVGILLGDGSINIYPHEKYSTYYRIKVSFHSEENEYTLYVQNLMQKVLGVKPKLSTRKKERTTELLIFKKQIVEKIIELGMKKSPKWNRAVIPQQFMNADFGKCILRGYFDTDGSVVVAKNNGTLYPRLEMKISPSPMQKQFLFLLDLYNFKYGKYPVGKGKIRIQLNGKKQLSKWMEFIGTKNPKHSAKEELFQLEYSIPQHI